MKKDRILKEVLKIKLKKENAQEEYWDQDGSKRLGKMTCRRKEERGRKQERSFRETEVGGEASYCGPLV
jgi:hypothetical protein